VAKAVERALQLNAELDRWYDGKAITPSYRPDGLEALDALLQRDPSFTDRMASRTQADYLRNTRPAIEWAGDSPVTAISRRAIREWHRGLLESRGASTARNYLAALRRLLSFGVDEEWIARNPALAMRIPVPQSHSRVWTVQERDVFCEQALKQKRPSMALAVMLGWCLGQRPADL
jgi:site-specific recombinase XerD